MRKIQIVGIGAGHPEHLTMQAVRALNELDVVFLPDKGEEKVALQRLRTAILERHAAGRAYRTVSINIPERGSSQSYKDEVAAWHATIAARVGAAIRDHLAEGECGGFLVWGDPSLYDSTIRIVETIQAGGLDLTYNVIPGISAVQALAAAHRVPLNRIGEAVAFVPARRLEEAWATGLDAVVVVLDGRQGYRRIEGDEADIFWGASLGLEDEKLVAGRLSEVADEIDAARRTIRETKGWVMDTYLLRRRRLG